MDCVISGGFIFNPVLVLCKKLYLFISLKICALEDTTTDTEMNDRYSLVKMVEHWTTNYTQLCDDIQNQKS